MPRPTFYRILEVPWVYLVAQTLVGPGSRRLERQYFQKIQAARKGMILDVGCGPYSSTPRDDSVVVGVDINPAYVARFTGGAIDTDAKALQTYQGPRKRFGFCCSAARLPFPDETFDEVYCRRLLHHLPDEVAKLAIEEMVRCTRLTGRAILMDPVWPRNPFTRPVAWMITKLDRGEWIRSEEELLRLAQATVPGSWSMTRYNCSYWGVEAVGLVLEKRQPWALRRAG